MCIAIPALIKSTTGMEAEVDMGGIQRHISLWLTPDARVNDYVLVHAGYSINMLDQEEAHETLELFKQMEMIEGDHS